MIMLNLDGQKFDHVSNGVLANNRLTAKPLVIILSALLPHVAVRFDSRQKHKMPVKARLLMDCVLKCKNNLWCALFSGSFCSHGSCAVSVNPTITFTARFLTESSGVPSNAQGTHHAAA